jgi:hypothetical protein
MRLLASSCIFFFFLSACKQNNLPRPQEGEENEKAREKFFELRHRSAPGTNWEKIESENTAALLASRKLNAPQMRGGVTEVFANGQLSGIWQERGSNNLSGNVRICSYDKVNDFLYSISDGGTLWKTNRTGSFWQILNQNVRFQPNILTILEKTQGLPRLLLATGIELFYSDDEGVTLGKSKGLTFPVDWYGNRIVDVIQHPNDKSIYCLTRPWDDITWSPRYSLYRSTNMGLDFKLIHSFDAGSDGTVSMTLPRNGEDLLILDVESENGKGLLFSIKGDMVSKIGEGNLPNGVSSILKGYQQEAQTILYVLSNNREVYQSLDMGDTWQMKGNLPKPAWDMFEISNTDPSKLYAGEVDAYRSVNSGSSWIKVNSWASYYNDIENKLHADIMEIECFKTADNKPFIITSTHGGAYISYDDQVTTKNISLAGHNIGQFYDVLTDPDNTNFIYGGTQDQGFQRTLNANSVEGPVDFIQVISGDYGYLTFTGSPRRLWIEYPFGSISYFHQPNENPSSYWQMKGRDLPNYGWMLPIENTYNNKNEVYIGGGNILNGPFGTGSYLIKLAAAQSAPFSISASQFAYNFRPNTMTGSANISSLAVDPHQPDTIYVAAEDGSFFYSYDGATSWQSTQSFKGPEPWYLYGSDILVSAKNKGHLWYCGSGYSNAGVYESANGGQSFTAMANGLPPTLVYEMAANLEETMLFAATEAGPYVCVLAEKKWYPMLGEIAPIQTWCTVEYVAKDNVVRFGTFGRGIWDFKIENSLPVEFLSFSATLQGIQAGLQWSVSGEETSKGFYVERSTDGRNFSTIAFIPSRQVGINQQHYSYLDGGIERRIYFYRIRQVDVDNSIRYSSIERVDNSVKAILLSAFPNPARTSVTIKIDQSINLTGAQLRLLSSNGIMLKDITVSGHQFQVSLTQLPPGKYYLHLIVEGYKEIIPIVKL